MSQVPTELVTVLSSTHGRKRRKQRKISKSDLQAAVKHGLKTPANAGPDGHPRWKYTYKNVVYITDASGRKEVTSWPLHKTITTKESSATLEIQPIPASEAQHNVHVQTVISSPHKVTSHTVVVVDMSGSMRTEDVGTGTRAKAVYETLAQNLVKKQLKSGGWEASMLDVVSVVEMRDTAELVLEAVPLDATLFNTLISRWKISRPSSHGKYVPSLQMASQLLDKFSHGGCALCLLFLSDGKPSDHPEKGWVKSGSPFKKVMEEVVSMSETYGRRLVFGTIGFADENEDFTVLKKMADKAKGFSVGTYQHATEDLGAAVTSVVTSLTSTKLEMTSADGITHRTIRAMTREQASESSPVLSTWKPEDVKWYADVNRSQWSDQKNKWVPMHMSHPKSNSIVIRRSIFGEGAERVVYAAREALITDESNPCQQLLGEDMVAKESRFIEDMEAKDGGLSGMTSKVLRRYQLSAESFHTSFCRTQQTAQKMAEQFNLELRRRLPPEMHMQVPQVLFLECVVYFAQEEDDDGCYSREVLAEKRLDVDKYKKWNSNAGYVAGQKRARKGHSWGAIPEEEEEQRSEADGSVSFGMEGVGGKRKRSAGDEIEHEDIPQAFSHFSWEHSAHSILVCDLQGVYSESASRAKVFELTDPVIHHASTDGPSKTRASSYGRTDKGFLQTISDADPRGSSRRKLNVSRPLTDARTCGVDRDEGD